MFGGCASSTSRIGSAEAGCAVQSCRGSHTPHARHDLRDPANVYIYVSGTRGRVSPQRCGMLSDSRRTRPPRTPIEVIRCAGTAAGCTPLQTDRFYSPTARARWAGLARRNPVKGLRPRGRRCSATTSLVRRDRSGRRLLFGKWILLDTGIGKARQRRRGDRPQLQLLPLGDVQQRRHEGAVHGEWVAGERRAVPRERPDRGVATRSSRSRTARCATSATSRMPAPQQRSRIVSRTTAR